MKDEPPKIVHSPLGNNQLNLTEKLGDANGISVSGNSVDCIKSAISIVQEIAQKRNLPIRFMVENETGPAHMKHFIIKCSVGEIEVSITFEEKKNAKTISLICIDLIYLVRLLVMEIRKKLLKSMPPKIC